jgi:hypothetical protein
MPPKLTGWPQPRPQARRNDAMIDIAILALPADTAAAGCLLDAFKSRREPGGFRVQLAIAHPHDADWRVKEAIAIDARAVLICCSAAVGAPDAALFRALAAQLAGADRAIAVELEPGGVPVELAGCSAYQLHDKQLFPPSWSRLLFGHPRRNLITAAATDKAEGRDPPSETAIWTIRLTQLFLRLGPVALIIGVVSGSIGIADWEPVQKLWHADTGRAWAAAQAKGCPAARAFADNPDYAGSPWAGEVMQFLAGCPDPERVEDQEFEEVMPFFVMQADAPVARSEAAARAASLAKFRSDVAMACRDNPANAGGEVLAVELSDVRQQCGRVDGGTACSTDARAICKVRVPMRVPDQREG